MRFLILLLINKKGLALFLEQVLITKLKFSANYLRTIIFLVAVKSFVSI